MDIKKLQFHYFIGLLLLMLGFTIALFWPFVASLALALMAAIIIRPVHRKLLKSFGHRPTLAALTSVLFVLVVICGPLAFIIERIAVESLNFYSAVQQGGGDITTVAAYIVKPIQSVFPGFAPDVQSYMSSLSDVFVNNFKDIFSGTASLALNLFIAIVALFYMLRDGHRFKKAIIELSPLADVYDRQIIDKIERAINSVVRGSLFIAIIRGVLTGAGFAFFGVPHPIIWGAVTAIVSLLPNIGLFITLIPAVVYLIVQNSIGGAVGLAAWSILAVGTVDNFLMPLVMGKGFTVHPIFILLSVLGGLIFFGPIGLLLGPLVIAFLSALLEIYKVIVIEDHSLGTSGN